MKYSEFRNIIFENVKEILGDSYCVELKCNIKNNNKKHWAIIVSGQDERVVPSIGLEYFYNRYINNEFSLGEVVEEVIDIYNSHKNEINIEDVLNEENIINNSYCKLINRECNKQLLQSVPHFDFLDLSIVFYTMINDDAEFCQTMIINNSLLDMLKITKESLYKIAIKNTYQNLGIKYFNINEVLYEIVPDAENLSDIDMYVLTNNRKFQGAISMMDMETLQNISKEFDSNLIILPSSIHEVIIIPFQEDISLGFCKEMVTEINNTEVDREDILSNSVYLYDRSLERLDIYR